jgi:hypothetical protein
MSAAEFDLAVPTGMLNLGFTPLNGFMNTGGASDLLLSVAGCPEGPVVAGSWSLSGLTPGSFCLVNSAAHGISVTVDCDPVNPMAWAINTIGYGYGVGSPSCNDPWLCIIDGVESLRWGSVKSPYR